MNHRRPHFRLTIALLAATTALAGCSQADSAKSSETGTSKTAAFSPVSSKDGTGATVTIDRPVKRVVCLTGACDDALVSMGLRPVASTEAGKDGLLSDPHFLGPQATEVTVVGGSFGEENLEDVINAKPDLVIGLAGAHDRLAASLRKNVPTYLVKIGSYQQMNAYTTWVGKVTDHPKEAAGAIAKFTAALDTARKSKNTKASSLAMFGTDVNFGVDTTDSLLGSVLSELAGYPWPTPAGGGDQGHEAGAATYSLEQVLRVDPTVIFVQTFSYGPKATTPVSQQLKKNPVWAKLSAVQKGRVVEVPTRIWATGRGPISMTAVVEQASKELSAS